LKILSVISRASSTELAIFEEQQEVKHKTVEHPPSELHAILTPSEQGQFRFNAVMEELAGDECPLQDIDMVVTQVSSQDLPPGIYMIDDSLLRLMSKSRIDENQYRSGVYLAHSLSQNINSQGDVECMPIAVGIVILNEITTEASLSGLKGIVRDALSYNSFAQRSAAAHYAWFERNTDANEIRIVIAHLGKVMGAAAFDRGRVTDCNSPQDGEGPFSPFTCGTVPLDALIDLCYSGRYDMDEMMQFVSGGGGLAAYLPDASLEAVMDSFRGKDARTVFLVRAMACKVAREIGARAAALKGNVERIVLTGPWSVFDEFVKEITSRVEWIAPVKIYFIESELKEIANAAIGVFRGIYKILLYEQDRK
jgi:butyrate kinase